MGGRLQTCRAARRFSAALAALAAAVASVCLEARAAVAMDICAETVPANRFIDGFPAYAQCAGSMNGAVYSNDGVNTATASGGTGWIRTQTTGGYQCTELAHRYLAFRWNIKSVPNGNAGVWCDATLPAGVEKATAPVHGDLIVFAPGSCGADATTGHVAVVDVVNADGSVSAVQQNVASRSKYSATCAACFLHVTGNDGSPADGGAPDSGTSGAGGASGAAGVPGTGGRFGGGGAGGRPGGGGGAGTTATAGSAGTGAEVDGGAGTGGTTGTAGTNGSGEAGSPGSAGTSGTAGDGSAGAPAGGSGCACHVAGGRLGGHAYLCALGLLALVWVRRRDRGGQGRKRSRSSRP